MFKNIILPVFVFLNVIFVQVAFAGPCYVSSENDSGQNTLRKIVTNGDCSIDSNYYDYPEANQLVGFTTQEAFPDAASHVRTITLETSITISPSSTLIVGNATPDMLDTGDLSYDYTPTSELGFVVIDGHSKLSSGEVPFSCTGTVWLRNMIILTNAVSYDEIFGACRSGGAIRVCQGSLVVGTDLDTLDPDESDGWCTGVVERGEVVEIVDPNDVDDDGDGYTENAGDCDDTNADIHPNAEEIAGDRIDNNCDGTRAMGAFDVGRLSSVSFVLPQQLPNSFVWCRDADGDGYYVRAMWVSANSDLVLCEEVESSDDCDDTDAAIHPVATETCDGVDNNCNDEIDEDLMSTFYVDEDGDGFGDANNSIVGCGDDLAYVADSSDCDDTDSAINPSGIEACDELDNNCDGQIDEDDVCVVSDAETVCSNSIDDDGDGYTDCYDSDCYGVVINSETGEICPNPNDTPVVDESGGGCGCQMTGQAPVSTAGWALGVIVMTLWARIRLKWLHSPSPGCPVRKRGEEWRSDRGVACKAKPGNGFGVVPPGFVSEALRGSAGCLTPQTPGSPKWAQHWLAQILFVVWLD